MLRAVLVALFAVLFFAPAQAEVAHWGNETWVCGTSQFDIVLGNGSDIQLSSISGAVTAAPRGNATDKAANTSRQSLLVIYSDRPRPQVSTTNVTGGPANNEIDPALLMVNGKTIGLTPVVIPVYLQFTPPVTVPAGRLHVTVVGQAEGPIVDNVNCINAETHLTFQW